MFNKFFQINGRSDAGSLIGKFSVILLLTIVLSTSALVLAGPSNGAITWDQTYSDAVTGDNEFKSGGKHYWFTNTSADQYDIDKWERPNAQTDKSKQIDEIIGGDSELANLGVGASVLANGTSDPSYHAYLDIVSGSYAIGTGGDTGFMFFGIELYGDYRAGESGIRDDAEGVFGEGSQYRIRMSNGSEGAYGLMIGSDAGADYNKGGYDTWSTLKNYGWFDKDGEVGGDGGIATPDEGVNKGYQAQEVIKSDGKTTNGDKEVLWTRYRHDDDTGRSFVEFALDLTLLESKSNFELDPTNIGDLVFETDRGIKDENKYLWNDAYSESEAGSPYTLATQNIYELDNLRAGSAVVPVPSALLLGSIGCAMVGWMRKRKSL